MAIIFRFSNYYIVFMAGVEIIYHIYSEKQNQAFPHEN